MPTHFAPGEKSVRVECCGRRLARGRHRDLPALRVLAPAPLLVLVLLLVLAAATRRSRGQCGLGDRTRADLQAGCLTPPVRAHEVPTD